MDSHLQGFLLSPPTLHPVYYQTKEEDGIIDLGLSLRTLQPQVYHPTGNSSMYMYNLFLCSLFFSLFKSTAE